MSEVAIPSLSDFVEIGGMTSIALVLLWQLLKAQAIQAKGIKAVAVTMITHQQMLLVFASHGHVFEDCEDCKRLIEQVKDMITHQQQQLDRLERE